ncbi:MAG: hypothetical protein AAFR88_10620 [Pseudomonadota bacterium]
MSKAIALTRMIRDAAQARSEAITSGIVVLSCAAALILARQPLPL